MQKINAKFLLSFLFAALFHKHLYSNGRDVFSSLNVTPSPRAAALGEAFVAVADGAETVFYNPAGLAFQEQTRFYAQSMLPLSVEDLKLINSAAVSPVNNGAWAAAIGFLYSGGFKQTIADSSSADGFKEGADFSAYDLQASGSYGRKIWDNFGLGASLRYLRSSLADASANGIGVDVGFLYKHNEVPVQLGAAVQHIGPKVKFQDESFDLPAWIKAGVSLHQPNDSTIPLIPTGSLVTGEFVKPLRGEGGIRGGIEVPVFKIFLIRTGYQHTFRKRELGTKAFLPANLTLGFGIRTRIWHLDYATVSLAELGLAHRIAIEIKWGEGN